MNLELVKWVFGILFALSMVLGLVLSRKVTTLRAAVLAHIPLLLVFAGIPMARFTHSLALGIGLYCLMGFWFWLVKSFYGALLGILLDGIYRTYRRRQRAREPRPSQEQALAELAERRRDQPEQKQDSKEYRYFYCESCGHLADLASPRRFVIPPRLCAQCDDLKHRGWLPE